MFQVRIHGRGGQGVATAAELLSVAAYTDGRYGEAFTGFGRERTAAPAVAFCQIDDQPIHTRAPVIEPDALIVQDPTLLHQVDVFERMKPDAYILINSHRTIEALGLGPAVSRFSRDRVVTVPATDIARRALGRPLPNTALIGGFAALCGVVSLASVQTAIQEHFSGRVANVNAAAAQDAFALVRLQRRDGAGARPASQ